MEFFKLLILVPFWLLYFFFIELKAYLAGLSFLIAFVYGFVLSFFVSKQKAIYSGLILCIIVSFWYGFTTAPHLAWHSPTSSQIFEENLAAIIFAILYTAIASILAILGVAWGYATSKKVQGAYSKNS